MSHAYLSRKVVFWYNGTSGEIRTGFPEEYDAPYGFEKIVCTTAHEAEIWSERQRRWDEFKHGMAQAEREMVEGPMRDNIRKHILHLMGNARNNLNREFLRRHLERMIAVQTHGDMKENHTSMRKLTILLISRRLY